MIEGACHCGEVRWTFDGVPESATSCNCTLCRRYGVLWIYDYVDGKIRVTGPTASYQRRVATPDLEILFCPRCACVAAWRATSAEPDGRVRIAVNLRLAEPTPEIEAVPLDRVDGLNEVWDLPPDGRCVRDLWC